MMTRKKKENEVEANQRKRQKINTFFKNKNTSEFVEGGWIESSPDTEGWVENEFLPEGEECLGYELLD